MSARSDGDRDGGRGDAAGGADDLDGRDTAWVDGLTIGEVLRHTARRFPGREALVFRQSAERFTYRQFDAAVDDAARGLLALGLRRGDHFGVWSTNWPAWVLLQFGAARAGVVLTTINPAYRPDELRYALRQSRVRGLALLDRFKTSDYRAILRQVCPEVDAAAPGALRAEACPDLRWVVSLRGPAHPAMWSFERFLEEGAATSAEALAERERSLLPDDAINLQYTSGTTGHPKGAVLTHRNLLLNCWHAGRRQGFVPGDRLCVPVPLYHCFGCVLGTLCAVVHGVTMVFPHESFHAGETLAALADERCSAVYGVPTMFIALLEHPEFAAKKFPALRTGIMAGSPCPIELMKRVTAVMGAREITIGYGQTEASPLITQTDANDPLELRVGTVGRVLPGVEVKIVDPATGVALPDEQDGELCARGHVVMRGYFDNVEATAKAIDGEGWLHTGDLARREPNGYFRITGRLKDMIIRGGENISPREIEERLYQHAGVEEAQVVGVPDLKYGEEVLAWVKPRAGAALTCDELRDFCRQTLAYFKVPKHIKFVDAFPTTVTGKIQKFKIRQQAIEELGLQAAANVETA